MFSETRYARNGDLRVAYRASREGPRDIVFVPNWFTNCEVVPELPSIQSWVEAMTSLGRLIFFDQPGMGASDPVTPGAPPTLEQWADSITAVLDDLGSREAVLLASAGGALATAALFAATHPSRATALVVLEGHADPLTERFGRPSPEETAAMWGTGKLHHLLNPDMPWNEEIRATWARTERLAASPGTAAVMMPLAAEMDVRPLLPAIRVPTLVVQHADDLVIPPECGKDVADHISGAKYVELPGHNMYHFVEPWRRSFQEIAEFLTGHQADVADDRVHEHVVRPCQCAHAGADVHGDSADVFAADLALAGVQPGTHLDAERLHRVAKRHRAADRSLRAVEHREETVTRRVHLAAPKANELRPDDGVVRVEQGMPVTVADLPSPARRVHDVGEKHCGDSTLRDLVIGSGLELWTAALMS